MGKPKITIDAKGPDGNIYAILGKVRTAISNEKTEALRRCGDPIEGMTILMNFESLWDIVWKRATSAVSYKQAISIIEEYVTIEWKGGVPM